MLRAVFLSAIVVLVSAGGEGRTDSVVPIPSTLAWPPPGMTVPTNAVFYLEVSFSQTVPVLASERGTVVETRIERIDVQDGDGYLIKPVENLDPRACYTMTQVPPLFDGYRPGDADRSPRWCTAWNARRDETRPILLAVHQVDDYQRTSIYELANPAPLPGAHTFATAVSEPVRYEVRDGDARTGVAPSTIGFQIFSIALDPRYATVVAIDMAGNASDPLMLFPEGVARAARSQRRRLVFVAALVAVAVIIGVVSWRRRWRLAPPR